MPLTYYKCSTKLELGTSIAGKPYGHTRILRISGLKQTYSETHLKILHLIQISEAHQLLVELEEPAPAVGPLVGLVSPQVH